MTLDRDPVIYLDDILDAATKATQFVADSSFDEFEHDDRTTYAVLRALEIIGEAAKRVPIAVPNWGNNNGPSVATVSATVST